MTTPDNLPILHTETYQGRTITIVEVPRRVTEWSARAALINGGGYGSGKAAGAKADIGNKRVGGARGALNR